MPIQTFLKEHQRGIHTIGLIVAIGLQVMLALNITSLLKIEFTNAITFAVLSYILYDISANTSNSNRNKAYDEQADMYVDLEKYIDEHGAKEAVFVQHSGRMAVSLLRKLVNKGARVTMYVENPENAVSLMQKGRIENTLKELSGELRSANPHLVVYRYDVPTSVRGVSVDNKVLAIGWYTYEHALDIDPHFPDDKVELSGHDVPGLLLYAGTTDYAVFSRMFMNLVKNYEEYIRIKGLRPALVFPS